MHDIMWYYVALICRTSAPSATSTSEVLDPLSASSGGKHGSTWNDAAVVGRTSWCHRGVSCPPCLFLLPFRPLVESPRGIVPASPHRVRQGSDQIVLASVSVVVLVVVVGIVIVDVALVVVVIVDVVLLVVVIVVVVHVVVAIVRVVVVVVDVEVAMLVDFPTPHGTRFDAQACRTYRLGVVTVVVVALVLRIVRCVVEHVVFARQHGA
jgi:LysM repeat protein